MDYKSIINTIYLETKDIVDTGKLASYIPELAVPTKLFVEKIFALNTERKKGTAGEKGSGLGLVLCKDLIELNKGTIKAISEIGKGSTFVISLPKT